MADKKFIIEVRTKGFAKANRDMGKLDTSSKSYDKTAGRMRGTTNGLQGSIGALRNRILVYTFAIGGAVGAMNKFVKAASGFQDVKTRLVGLTGSVEEAEIAFQAFNKIAATTPFALDDVVNAGAQLQAFGVDAEATLSATTDLAAFMGTTATEAASSLGRAFAGGAGAADILRERGILQLIKDSQGIKDLTKLTLPQFRQALLKAMVDPVAGIQGSSERLSKTFTGAMSNMQDAITRFAALIGEELLPGLTKMANSTEKFFRSLDLKKLAEFGTALTGVSAIILIARNRTVIWASAMAVATSGLNVLLGALAIFLAQKGIQAVGLFNNLATATTTANTSQQNLTQSTNRYIQSVGQTNIVLEQNLELRKALEEITRTTFLLHLDNEGMDSTRLKTIQMMFDAEKLLTDKLGSRVKIDREAIVANGEFIVSLENATDGEAAYVSMVARSVEEQRTHIATTNRMAEAQKQEIIVANQLAGTINIVAGAMRNLSNEEMNTMQKTQEMIKIMGSLMMVLGAGTPVGAVGSVFTALGSIPVGHTGGLVKNDGIQRFAQGGMVQGRDNVPIMAQAGEFIMRREAVQNIGVQNLAQMNKTGQGGVTVNIQGNMIGNDEFVRDNLLPQIAKAARQNLA